MDFDGNFKFWGRQDVGALARVVLDRPEEMWSDHVAKKAHVHRHGRGVFLKNDVKPEPFYGTVLPCDPRLPAETAPMLEAARARIEAGYFIRLQFSRHLPGRGFESHTDLFSFALCNCHRLHLPVVTNKDVWFEVGGERRHIPEGEIWEVNNIRAHSGANEGQTPRIHMIIDIARPLFTVTDRLRALINLEVTAGRDGFLVARPQLADDPPPMGLSLPSGAPPVANGRVERDVVVSLNYRLIDDATGEVLSEDMTEEPLSVVHGRRQLPPALDHALAGLKVGETFSVRATAEEAYGPTLGDLVFEIPEADLPKGMGAAAVISGRAPFLALMDDVDEKTRLVDPNHPFSGLTVRFEGEIRAIRSLDADEYRYALYEGPSLPSGDQLRDAVATYVASPKASTIYGGSSR